MVTCYVCAFWAKVQFLSERGKTKAVTSKIESFLLDNYNVFIFFLTLSL